MHSSHLQKMSENNALTLNNSQTTNISQKYLEHVQTYLLLKA